MNEAEQQALIKRWMPLTQLWMDRLPGPYWLWALLLGAVVFAEQIMEQRLLGPWSRLQEPQILLFSLALPLLTTYMFIVLRRLKQDSLVDLAALRPVVKIDDRAFDHAVKKAIVTSERARWIMLGLAAAIVVGWFAVARLPYPLVSSQTLPANPLAVLLTLVAYTIFGMAGLLLVYSGVRFGHGIAMLAEAPLAINLWDAQPLLPFGRLSLRYSLAIAGMVLLILIPFGVPEAAEDYLVISLASLGSLSALILPLRGVHRQMVHVRNKAASHISDELADCQVSLVSADGLREISPKALVERIEPLMALRSRVNNAPTWPFLNVSAMIRVTLAALSPLLYFVLNEVVRTYLLPLLGVQ
ncbi:MAG: hypothetical protein KDD73_07260 [Anaerolineales bacterium]|nr:hypothetical protein [Anaerolineales bacterium]MCB9127044.1 hypothetical protein [Ardenticatenales bacterium]MCB9172432.1 hypothetical protein [Ardenticatenales bacterium]